MDSTRVKSTCPQCGKPVRGHVDWMWAKRVLWCGSCGWEGDQVMGRAVYRKNGELLTWRMKQVEQSFCQGESLATWLPKQINQDGMTNTARRIGLTGTTLYNWCTELGIVHRYVAVPPGYRIRFVKE